MTFVTVTNRAGPAVSKDYIYSVLHSSETDTSHITPITTQRFSTTKFWRCTLNYTFPSLRKIKGEASKLTLTLYLHLIAFPRISRENVRESSPIPTFGRNKNCYLQNLVSNVKTKFCTGGTPAEVGRHKRGSGSKLKRVMSLPTHSSALGNENLELNW